MSKIPLPLRPGLSLPAPRHAPLRALARLALLLWALATLALTGWAIAQNPLTQPFVDRSEAQIHAALTRAMAGAVTPGWLLPRLARATETGDSDDIRLLLSLADRHGIVLPPESRARAEAVLARESGFTATAEACGLCMIDTSRCPSLALLGACAIPFEMSPAGDVKALGREGWTWATGGDPDPVDAALAGIGLAATIAALPSAGASLGVKAGASALRLARKTGSLSPELARALKTTAREGGGTERLTAMAGDVTRIARATSPAEALPILRLARSPEELSRLARFSEAAGPETRGALRVLGRARALRLTHRVSDLLVAAFGAAMALLAQIGAALGALLKLFLRRMARG